MWHALATPWGAIAYDWNGARLVRVRLGHVPGAAFAGDDPAARWLSAYFRGDPLPPLPPLAPPATPFQARLRKALLAIPAGEVRSYGALARELGTSPRALGQALRANPLPLVVPCHRVVAARGLGGFAAGAIWKARLLAWERLLARECAAERLVVHRGTD